MLKNRIIPMLLLSQGRFVKTERFRKPKYVGDPINTIRIFNDKEVDELIVVDIDATNNNTGPNFDMIEQFASESFSPLCYGGGISNIEQVKKIFKLGIEKVCIQTAALKNPNLINQISEYFGSQSIIVSIDIKRNLFNKLRIYAPNLKKYHMKTWSNFFDELLKFEFGEILINSVDKDGTLVGPDLELIQEISKKVNIPLIYAGGVSSLKDIKTAVEFGADAVAAGSFFVFHGPHKAVVISYPNFNDIEELFKIN